MLSALPHEVRSDRSQSHGHLVWIGSWLAGIAAVLTLSAAATAVALERRWAAVPLPAVKTVDVFAALFDTRPLTVTITIMWQKLPLVVPRWQFVVDQTIWLRMNVEDWDHLPEDIRGAGIDAMLARYGALVSARRTWPTMTATDWDIVPPTIRAMAFVGMIEQWLKVYDVGEAYELDPRDVTRTAKAIAMSESWFNHRAAAVNRDGSRDIGLGGASEFARDVVRRWHADGRVDFTFTDQEYFNPWKATRWLAFWFGLMIDEARGDLDLAVRAYNWGIGRAEAGEGHDYLALVRRRRTRYFEGPSFSPTWRILSAFRRAHLAPASAVAGSRAPMK